MGRYAALCLVLALGFGTVVGVAAADPPPDAAPRDRPAQATSSTAAPDCPHERIREISRSVGPSNGSAGTDRAPTDPRVVELYPNPTARGNVGEYLVLEVPPNGLEGGNWTLTDGHTTAALPNETGSGTAGRVALSADPAATEPLTDVPVRELEGTLRLAVDGDGIELRNGTATVDRVAYERAPLAERWYRTPRDGADRRGSNARNATADGRWWPREATCRPVSRATVDEATAFVLPDAPDVPLETIRGADDRLLLAGYTVTSRDVARELVAAVERGVDVAVLLESGPVGGAPAATESVLETLATGGVDVRAIGGEGARYRYHHPKYAVADDRVLVTSENWKPAGVGGRGSRGWGVRLEDADLAAELAAVFRADFEGWDTRSGAAYRADATFVDDDSSDATRRRYPTEHEPATVPVDAAELLLAPDNAEGRLAELIASAEDEILVEQAALDRDVALLEAVLDAAERGVEVEILLDSAWYHEDENAAVAADLERTAARDDLPLEVRLVEDTDRFEKIHAKGLVIDREVAVIGSANWNDNAFENNREVLVVLHGDAVGAYYAAVFDADWSGDAWSLPIELSAAVVVALVGAALVGRRYVRFGDERRDADSRPPQATSLDSESADDGDAEAP